MVDIHRLKAWAVRTNDESLLKALAFMSDDPSLPTPFTIQPIQDGPHGVPTSDQHQSIISRGFSPFDIGLINSISEPCSTYTEPSLPLFKVPKKTGKARLVQDGRPINARTSRPPPMGLPDLDAIISRAKSHPHMAQADAKAFFYQLPLAPRFRPFFAFSVGSLRGRFERRQLTRTPMGFNHAPFGAQAVSNAVSKFAMALTKAPPGNIFIEPWVDNFIVAATTPEGLQEGKRALARSFRFFRLQADWVPSRQVLGLSFSPSGVCLARDFVEKAMERLRDRESMTSIEVMQAMGCVMWAMITTIRHPLSETFPLLRLLQTAATANGPDDIIPLSPETRKAMATWRRLLRQNARFTSPSFPQEAPTLWTDASMSTAAAVSVFPTTARYVYTPFATQLSIFYKELLAAYLGVSEVSAPKPSYLLTDNQALAAALAKGHSTAGGAVTNTILASVLRNICGVAWVPTDQQQADSLTRIPRALPNPLLQPCTTYRLYQSYFLPGGRGKKEREGGPILHIHNHNKPQQPQNCLFVNG